MKGFLPFFVLLVSLSCFSCKSPQAFVYRDVKNFKISNLGFTQSKVSMDLLFFNPNSFSLKLKKVDCDLFLDSNYVGKVVLDTLMIIPRSSEFSLPASFSIDMKNLFKNSLDLIFNREVLIGAKGTTRVGKGLFYVTIPFNYEGRQRLNLLQ